MDILIDDIEEIVKQFGALNYHNEENRRPHITIGWSHGETLWWMAKTATTNRTQSSLQVEELVFSEADILPPIPFDILNSDKFPISESESLRKLPKTMSINKIGLKFGKKYYWCSLNTTL